MCLLPVRNNVEAQEEMISELLHNSFAMLPQVAICKGLFVRDVNSHDIIAVAWPRNIHLCKSKLQKQNEEAPNGTGVRGKP